VAGLILLAGAAVTLAYFYLRGSIQPHEGQLELQGLDAGVSVGFDEFAIPIIEAATESDLYRAQGFVHASERLWQLELFQRIARGELSEIFGDAAVETDRLIRTLDLWGAAETSLTALGPAERALLDAYAEGVNARMDSWRGPWPPEFIVLGIEPRRWSPQATAAIGRIMALDLSTWRTELNRIRASARLPVEKNAELETGYPAWGPTILQDGPAEEAANGIFPSPAFPTAVRVPPRPEWDDAAGRAIAGVAESSGSWNPLDFLSGFGLTSSNSWAISGTRTADGHPIVASDMHLSLRAPATWYINGLHARRGGLHVVGLSIPGAPGVVVGYNRYLAWAFTNGMVDDADFAIETVNLDGSAYRSGDGWVPFDTRREMIRVRGRNDPIVQEVRETERGPVISDVVPSGGLTLSLLWTGHYPVTEMPGLLRMNRARTKEEFDQAVQLLRSPHQNVIYATTGGDLGYRLSGSVPRRAGFEGAQPISIREVGAEVWNGFWPPDSMPSRMDSPPTGFIASANNLQSSAVYGVVGTDYPLPLRARRIVDRLEGSTRWTLEGVGELQRDTRSLWAERLLPRAIAAARRVGETSLASELAAWDTDVRIESSEATLFHVWLYMLRERLAADEWEGDSGGWFPDGAFLRILEAGQGAWVDDIRTPELETLEELEDETMRSAISHAAGRPWGEVHRERSRHPLGEVEWLNRLFRFHVGPYPGPGGPFTVRPDDPHRWRSLDSTSWTLPIVSEYGPSERFVVRLAPDGPLGFFLLPTGQSGNPLSRHYRDMMYRWPSGDLIEVPLELTASPLRSVSTLQLEPTGSVEGSETR
jgi:penicillin amidase